MPSKRTRLSRGRIADIPREYWELLNDRPAPADGNRFAVHYFVAYRRELWRQHRDVVLEEWIARSPGTRPSCWWMFDAPEPRPRGESEAAYLRRHALLLEREGARLDD